MRCAASSKRRWLRNSALKRQKRRRADNEHGTATYATHAGSNLRRPQGAREANRGAAQADPGGDGGSAMKEILGKAKTIRELLKGVKYSIDYYQREYNWQEKQIHELVDDLSTK